MDSSLKFVHYVFNSYFLCISTHKCYGLTILKIFFLIGCQSSITRLGFIDKNHFAIFHNNIVENNLFAVCVICTCGEVSLRLRSPSAV